MLVEKVISDVGTLVRNRSKGGGKSDWREGNSNQMIVHMLALLCLSCSALAEVCPGGGTSCPHRMTCCILPSGKEGCCPYANATCCPDQVHCCPQGSSCDRGGGGCKKEAGTSLLEYTKLGSDQSNRTLNQHCLDGRQCADDSTCCLMQDESYGCCPLRQAVCCKDKLNCCPYGTVCDGHGYCTLVGKNKVTLGLEILARSNNLCPGGQYHCGEEETCCPMGGGVWACCPAPNAVCCSDHSHCCPEGTRCTQESCIRANSSIAAGDFDSIPHY